MSAREQLGTLRVLGCGIRTEPVLRDLARIGQDRARYGHGPAGETLTEEDRAHARKVARLALQLARELAQ